ncbi:MAG: tagaturonate reductase [Acutalibacteraceae bacterium]|nr:tagaturonate reductase [Acutalibacteraceae bacterium]
MKETVIQFGEGNFLRGFFDYFLDVMNKKGLYDGKAVVIQPREGGKCEKLNAQDCKYNLYLRGIEKGKTVNEHHIVESVSRGIDPYKNYEEYMALAENPDLKFVVSNTTEAGIAFDCNCDFNDKPCKSFPGKLTQLLFERYKKGMKGFVFLPCELIDNNGDELKKCILKYAEFWQLDEGFSEWIAEKNTFCNTLVDRIVTGYPNDGTQEKHPDDKFLDTAEIFHLWVIEGDFENELPLKKAGFNVIWTDDARPYKKIKVRILNGAHTSLVAGAILSGLDTVGEAMSDSTASAFLNKAMNEEILPVIGKNEDSEKFASDVFDRFRNPFIHHKWRSIALNSVSKFSVRVLPTVLEHNELFGYYPKCLSMALAYLIYFYKNDTPEDSQEAVNSMKNGSISDVLKNTALWNTDLSDMENIVTECYGKIETLGAKEAMKWIVSQ